MQHFLYFLPEPQAHRAFGCDNRTHECEASDAVRSRSRGKQGGERLCAPFA
eukprot:COSAG04_NODE_31585_length_256_cov_0.649682_1_plen_50_part_01